MGQPSSGEDTDNSNSSQKKKFHISPRTIPGAANNANQGAVDWGECGLVAYGCNNTVVVVDSSNIQPLQTLDKHKFIVNRVLWGIGLRARLYLVSADLQGTIVVWDTCKGEARCTLQDGKNAILSMAWLRGYDEGDHSLLALHSPYTLILWDTTSQSKVWSTTYSDSILSFDVNPFHAGDIALLTSECILLWNNFSPTKTSPQKPKKFYVSSQAVSAARPNRASFSEERLGTNLKKLVRDMVVGETRPRADTPMKMRECQQLIYHQAVSNLLLLMYPLEILLLDLHISNIIGVIQLERSSSPLLQIVPARQRDVIYCLHETGSVSVRVRRRQPSFVGSPLDAPASSVSSVETGSLSGDIFPEVGYEQRCQSEVIRQTKGSRICGVTCSPICERRLALFLNTGKVVFLELQPSNAGSDWLFNLKDGVSGANPQQVDNLCDLIPPLLSDAVCSPMRLLCVGLMPVAASPLSTLRICPTRMARNDPSYQPLLALGTNGGLVQIINIATTAIERELAVHTHPVRGIEWASSQTFLSWSYPNATSGAVRNEVTLTHALTGHDISVRSNKSDEAPIDCIRVSPLGQYFIIAQRDGGLELWDLRTLHLIRAVTHSAFTITALEWCPIQKITKSASIEEKSGSNLNIAGDITEGETVVSESFCLSDGESKLYHFSVENNIVKDRKKFAAKPGKGVVTCLAYKGENVVQGDTEGMLKVWYPTGVACIATNNGPIKKILFSPLREKLLLLALHVDGVSFFDLNKAYEQKEEMPPKILGVQDIEWAGPLHPILAMQDGSIRIMDLTCSQSASPIETYEFREPPSSLSLLHPHIVTNLQILLAMRYWESDAENDANINAQPPSWKDLSTEDGFTAEQLESVRQQLSKVDGNLLSRLFQPKVLGTAGRSLLLSYLLGDTHLVDFWTIALYYLQIYRIEKQNSTIDDINDTRINKYPHVPPLDSYHDTLCDAFTYRKLQMERVALYENKRGDYARTQRVIQELIILGETDRAVQLLLETDLDHPQYYVDAMKACLIATMQTSRESAQSTFKLVATNLIANGKIWEGVQLLCLCSKGLDACHYLLLYGMWDEAVWLAKAVLPPPEAKEVLQKWTDYLLNSGRKHQAVLAMLSLGQFERVLEHLNKQKQFARAGLLLQACREFEIFPRHSQMDESSPSKLLSRIEMDLTCCLLRIGNRQATLKLGQRLGEHNIKLTREFHKMILENC